MAAPADGARSPVPLLRRWVVDYFNGHNDAAARTFIAPDYTLRIGEYTFAGRDAQWLPAVAQQFKAFPGLGMTVHQVLVGSDRVAACFSEHGASGGAGGRVACWSGVAIYRSNGEQLTGCVAQEDYFTRQRQLKSGLADAVEPPAAAPWDSVALGADAAAEAVVRNWLSGDWPRPSTGVRCDDEHITGLPLRFEVQSAEISELFSSGPDVAFHVRQTGRYLGGLPSVDSRDRVSVLHCNGIVRVQDGVVRSGRVIRNRMDLRASLLQEAQP